MFILPGEICWNLEKWKPRLLGSTCTWEFSLRYDLNSKCPAMEQKFVLHFPAWFYLNASVFVCAGCFKWQWTAWSRPAPWCWTGRWTAARWRPVLPTSATSWPPPWAACSPCRTAWPPPTQRAYRSWIASYRPPRPSLGSNNSSSSSKTPPATSEPLRQQGYRQVGGGWWHRRREIVERTAAAPLQEQRERENMLAVSRLLYIGNDVCVLQGKAHSRPSIYIRYHSLLLSLLDANSVDMEEEGEGGSWQPPEVT